MAIQGRKKIKAVTIDNRSVPQGNLKKVKETKMPKVIRRKKVLSRGKIIGILDFTVYLINKISKHTQPVSYTHLTLPTILLV